MVSQITLNILVENLMKLVEKTVIGNHLSRVEKNLKIEKGLKTLNSKGLIENSNY